MSELNLCMNFFVCGSGRPEHSAEETVSFSSPLYLSLSFSTSQYLTNAYGVRGMFPFEDNGGF
jgi:hypothetical protein